MIKLGDSREVLENDLPWGGVGGGSLLFCLVLCFCPTSTLVLSQASTWRTAIIRPCGQPLPPISRWLQGEVTDSLWKCDKSW